MVGAGPTGTEFAGGLAEIILDGLQQKFSDLFMQQAAVYLVDILPEVLMPFSKKLRLYAEKELENRHVRLRLNVAVKEIYPDHLLLSDGSTIATETVIWAGGVMAAPLIAHCGLPLGKGGRIEVASDLSARGFPSIYALGDCANISGNDGSFLPQLSTVAQQSGRVAAKNILRSFDGKSTRASHYVDRGITAIIGHRCVVANLGKRRFAVTGFLASMVWLFIHAPFLPDFRQRMKTIFKWVWQYFSK